uniref:Receptor protein-tyrosine kinase n=1 Tax=Oncorhynchus mykiss TaxID=8022 RepID=A0A8C7UFG3_ONCMY
MNGSGGCVPLFVLLLMDSARPTLFQFLKSPANVTLSLGKPLQVLCTLQGDGGGEEPPGVVWLRDGQSLDYADTNQVSLIDHVKLSDIGRYCCMATVGRKDLMSQEGHIQLEGIPHFSVKPHDVTVVATVSLSLQCLARGPPEPVRIIWLQNGGPLNTLQDPVSHSPSTLNITGLNHTSSFSCEAHNSEGVATSASGTVPEVTNSSLHISWEPGFGGVYPVSAAPSGPYRNTLRNLLIHNQNVYVPPAQHLIPELKPYTFYDVRVACRSSQGASPWTPWVTLHTAEGGKLYATIFHLQPISVYKIMLLILLGSVSLSVSACTVAGCGPWSPVQSLKQKHPGQSGQNRGRQQDGCDGYFPRCNVFRNPCISVRDYYLSLSTVNSLVISDELKQRLQDVMVDSHKLTLGKTLGEGEGVWLCPKGLLVHQQTVLKVAFPSRTEMEDFLGEAACMKEFSCSTLDLWTILWSHPLLEKTASSNRLRLLSIHQSLPSQMLVKFMTDVARGMEYLRFSPLFCQCVPLFLTQSLQRFSILAFLRRSITGDYYRQGCISKMPVKRIAMESLVDRVYTTKMVVWSDYVGDSHPGVENSEIYDYLRQGNRLKQPPGCLDTIYFLMFSCWLLSPKDCPGFPSLRCDLEKALEDMPEQEEADDLLYVNMEEPSGSLLGAIGGWEPFGLPHPSYWKNMGNLETIQVHHHDHAERYVLCPQHPTPPLSCWTDRSRMGPYGVQAVRLRENTVTTSGCIEILKNVD